VPPTRRQPAVRPFRGKATSVDEPLEFLRSCVYQQRETVKTLERLGRNEVHADELISACEFLSVDWPLHLHDISDSLATLLRERCKPADNIKSVFAELEEAQSKVETISAKTTRGLLAQIERMPEKAPTKVLCRQASELITVLRWLSAIESGIILPLARVRLRADDLLELAQQMRARRGQLED